MPPFQFMGRGRTTCCAASECRTFQLRRRGAYSQCKLCRSMSWFHRCSSWVRLLTRPYGAKTGAVVAGVCVGVQIRRCGLGLRVRSPWCGARVHCRTCFHLCPSGGRMRALVCRYGGMGTDFAFAHRGFGARWFIAGPEYALVCTHGDVATDCSPAGVKLGAF